MSYEVLNPYDSHKAHKYLVEARKAGGEWVWFYVYGTNRAQAAHVANALGWEIGSMSMEG